MNAYDTIRTRSFLVRYSRPDCEVIFHGCPSIGVSSFHLKGRDEYTNYLDAASTRLPDAVLLLLGSRVIRKFHEETSVIEIYINMKATRLTYSIVSSVGDQVSVDAGHVEVVEMEIKLKISIFMNREGLIVKIVGSAITSFPTFLTTPSTSTYEVPDL
eukprot:scaffold654_cov207-Ochromonas_danica.AAC.49